MAEQTKESRQQRMAAQEKIVSLLETDAQKAMAMMVEEYTALLWNVAEQYLKNPEDVRECVNDAFLQFYLHRDRYDSEKGTLPVFLAAIARNLAIDRYRKNQIRSAGTLTEELPMDRDDIRSADERIDIERAMNTLKPEDAEIIRMKYYGGMTVQEIADSLHLPYETVKKRHQRGLSKMRLALILSLILLGGVLLAACAYIVLHYFEVIPGFGVIDTPGVSVYILEKEVTIEDEAGVYTVESGYVVDGRVLLRGKVHFKSEDSSQWELKKDPDAPAIIALFRYGDALEAGLTSWKQFATRDRDFESGTHLLEIEADLDSVEITLILGSLEFPLAFVPAKLDSLEDYSYEMGEKGGVMAFPHWSEDDLVVDFYPLNVEGYTIPIYLVEGFGTLERLDPNVITLTKDGRSGPAGQSEIFAGIHSPGVVDIVSWNFGPVEPGAYTVHIPYLILEQQVEEPVSIPVDLAECQWEEQEYRLPGARVRVRDCQRLEAVPGELVPDTQEYAREGFSYWMVTLDYQEEWEGGDDFYVMPVYLRTECPTLEDKLDFEFGSTGGLEDDGYRLLIWARDGQCDLAHASITSGDRTVLKWEHSFDIPVMASPDAE